MNLVDLLVPVCSFLTALMLIPVLRKMAYYVQLVDKPNHRKLHQQAIPVMGGIAVFISVALVMQRTLQVEFATFTNSNLFMGGSILLLTGIIDDHQDISAILKLCIQLILAHFVFMEGIRIETLHGLFGIYAIPLWVQYVLTVMAITGVINAYNLMDGVDGLVGGLALIGLGIYTILSVMSNQYQLTLFFLAIMGSLVAFLGFNLSKTKKIFLGDAGSMVIGYVMVVSGIRLVQVAGDTDLNTYFVTSVVAVMLIPVFDTIRVFRKRIKEGKSPFRADKTHLHHLVLSLGLKHKMVTLFIVCFAAMLIVIGFCCYQMISLTFAVLIMYFVFYGITGLLSFHHNLLRWRANIQRMENAGFRR